MDRDQSVEIVEDRPIPVVVLTAEHLLVGLRFGAWTLEVPRVEPANTSGAGPEPIPVQWNKS